MLLLVGPAVASALSGFGVPGVGGAWAGPGERGPLGLPQNAAAAWTPTPELVGDLGLLQARYAFTLDGRSPTASGGVSAVPFLGATVPLGPVGVGATVFVPYARGGKPGDPEGPQRFHSIEGTILVVEADLDVATHLEFGRRPDGDRLVDLTVGAGPRYARMRMRSQRAFDTGALLHGLLGPEADVPLGEPLLEGTLTLPGLAGDGVGLATGLRVEVADRVTLAFGYRSAMRVRLAGAVELVPSNDLAMRVDGRVQSELVLPSEGWGSVRVAAGPVAVTGEAGRVGWSSVAAIASRVSGLEVSSPDPLMQGILESYGLSEAEFLDSLDTMVTTTGMRDVWVLGLGGEVATGRGVRLRAGVQHAGAAIPSPNVHPGNVDWATWDLRGAGWWDATPALGVGLGGDVILAPTRVVSDSALALTNPAESGMTLPSGNGRYALGAARLGLTVCVRPQPRL